MVDTHANEKTAGGERVWVWVWLLYPESRGPGSCHQNRAQRTLYATTLKLKAFLALLALALRLSSISLNAAGKFGYGDQKATRPDSAVLRVDGGADLIMAGQSSLGVGQCLVGF